MILIIWVMSLMSQVGLIHKVNYLDVTQPVCYKTLGIKFILIFISLNIYVIICTNAHTCMHMQSSCYMHNQNFTLQLLLKNACGKSGSYPNCSMGQWVNRCDLLSTLIHESIRGVYYLQASVGNKCW